MTPLTAPDFNAFFAEVRGFDPFPWQSDLVSEVLGSGRWPEVINVPTGLGKTALIDVAVFVAAASGCGAAGPGRRRIFFTIDRRIVVDEAFEHAKALAHALLAARDRDSLVGRVVQGLKALHAAADHPEPLVVNRMRGGLTWSWRWLDRPDRPAVVVGTVDQLGSRVLFGGYGIGPRLRPIDAALTGVDSLLIVDEAHLAQPFVETLRRAGSMAMVGDLPLAAPVVMTMSATPTAAGHTQSTFPVRLRDAESSAVAQQRLHAGKRLFGVRVPRKVDPVAVLAGYATELFDPAHETAAVGIVCNTVQRARDVASRLRVDAELAPHVHLLTGRIRPHDRDQLVGQIGDQIRAGRDRAQAAPIILVATQTIEVGANLDLDALVTESAPIDALVQRLGRLNRFGLPVTATRTCVVVHHELPQPLYGEARDRTWAFLVEHLGAAPAATAKGWPRRTGGIDASPLAMRQVLTEPGADLSSLVVAPARTPALMPEIVGEWAATSGGRPVASREPFLHGCREDQIDVSLVWRSGMPEAPDSSTADWLALVDRLPPVAAEQLEVPIGHVFRWLRNRDDAGLVGDVPPAPENGEEDEAALPDPLELRTPVLLWRGRGDGEVIRTPKDLRRVRPGDVLVVPSTAGGCDGEGWDPSSPELVSDLAEVAEVADRDGRGVVRIHHETLPRWLEIMDPEFPEQLKDLVANASAASDVDQVESIGAGLRDLGAAHGSKALSELAEGQLEIVRSDKVGTGILGVFAFGVNKRPAMSDGSSDDLDPAGSSASGHQVTLETHHAAVGRRAREISVALGLPEPIVESVALAAGLHDLGKCDPRFQVMLHGGDVLASRRALEGAAPLAKSGMRGDDRAAARRARREADLPAGYRHEAGSAQAVAGMLAGRSDVDPRLVLHLVAAHHGNARPLLPAVGDSGPTYEVRGLTVHPSRSVDLAHPSRFRQLSDQYGHWGLAMLETIVRLADIGCSEEGS